MLSFYIDFNVIELSCIEIIVYCNVQTVHGPVGCTGMIAAVLVAADTESVIGHVPIQYRPGKARIASAMLRTYLTVELKPVQVCNLDNYSRG